MVQLN
jgi:hypothetical protein